ncbi:MAG TPA: carboxypeptidase-like regulatory domain-containing protein [Bryobacteraceae bacterium]|nr:carboxypeptidase-like regulatory domain-containing protein [Bryobacteraceae bacterium]
MRIFRSLGVAVCLAAVGLPAYGQGVNGTITGTITDPSGSVVSGVSVEAKNVETGVLYTAASTNTGNYAIANLPVGSYIITATAPGFKKYAHTNLAIAAGQILKEDIPLEVGSAAESVTVSAEASLLKTESGETAHNITVKENLELPLLVITGGYRNPYATLTTLPGSSGGAVMNGLGGNGTNAAYRIEGQDSSDRLFNLTEYPSMAQANVDAIQEISYQTSNYAPEFGQGGGMVVNMTMKSGTNQYHGSGFEYFVNEDLNAGYPFSISGGPGSLAGGSGGKFRPFYRRHDFGGTLGGPVSIPKLYNGRDKTFFQWSYEEFRYNQLFTFSDTVPTPAFRNGDFSAISPNGTCSLCAAYQIPIGNLGGPGYADALGRPMFANEIYDPLSRATLSNGLQYASPFANNIVPASRFNGTALAMQALFPYPNPGNTNLVSNYTGSISGGQYSAIPTLKFDEIISTKDKLSFYWSRNNVETQINTGPFAADGLPLEIGQYRGGLIPTNTWRLNYDRTLTPTLLFHFGAGYMDTIFNDRAPFLSFDPSAFGLTGFIQHRQFPSVTGMCAGTLCAGGYGGMQNIGTSGQLQSWIHEERPTLNANATWVRQNHRFKAGAEYEIEGVIGYNADISGVTLATGVGPTSQPFQPSVSFNGFTQGFGYASFLLGDFTSINQTPNFVGVRNGYQAWGLFVQDSWKVTRKLTLDYGLRWDYATAQKEEHGRLGQLDGTLANANAGGRLGAIQYGSTCGCDFYKPTYPYAIGPRLGVAYQLDSKTVFRGGWGISYQYIAGFAGTIVSTPGSTPIPVQPNNSQYINVATPGSIVTPQFPTTNQFAWPIAGTTGAPPAVTNGVFVPDANQNRPPRINQWSAGFQREITPNFVVEASYVANRVAWLAGALGSGPLGFLSQISAQTYAHYGFYPYPGTGPCSLGGGVCASTSYDNDQDRNLLTQPLNSAKVQQALAARGFPNFLPYSGFPLGSSLQSALYPFPQFTSATGTPISVSGSPTGNSKYDSLQVKVTKRFSHNLQGSGAFTWGQGFNRATRQDFFNPASAVWALQNYPPRVLTFNMIYTVPKASFLPRVINALSKDWQFGWYSRYQTGAYLAPPTSPTANFLSSEDIRVPGQPLYTPGVDINDHSTFNVYYTQVLNPHAWAPCPTNSTCTATAVLYKDFRGPRQPSENANIGRHFRVGKEGKYDFYLRGEFVNIFNRTLLATPAGFTTNPQNPPAKGAGGGTIYTSGFGVFGNAYLTPNTAYANPGRTGTIIARFQF